MNFVREQQQGQLDELQSKLRKQQEDYHCLQTKHDQLHSSHLTTLNQLQELRKQAEARDQSLAEQQAS